MTQIFSIAIKILNTYMLFYWLCENRLSLNVSKTEFIIFRPPRSARTERITLKLNKTTIFESFKINYLGVILDPNLSWSHHIFELRKKLSRAVGMLYKLRNIKCDLKILKMVKITHFFILMLVMVSVAGVHLLKIWKIFF